MGWATDSFERTGLVAAVNQAADGLVITDTSGTILFVNPAFTAMTGYSSRDALGKCPRLLNSGLQLPAFYEELWRTIQSGKMWHGEIVNRRKDGTLYHEEMRIGPVRDANGEITGYVAAKRDITERILTVRALRVSEGRFCRLFEASDAVMLLIEPISRVIVDANNVGCSYYGYARTQLAGMPMSQISTVRHADVVLANQPESCNEHHFSSYLHRLSSGEERSVEVYSAPVDVDGKPLLFYIVHDVTERKRAQEALRVSEEHYRIAFQTSLDAISISQMIDGSYVEVNHVFVTTFGYERKDVVGKTALELGIWADPCDRQNLVEVMLQHSSCRDLEIQFRRKSGEVFWGLASASVISLNGKRCLLSVIRDISDAKAAEKEIKKLAFFDPLTGLPNRRVLLDRAGKTQGTGSRKGRNRALLFIDLDNFKRLNDTLGHEMGDLLLQEIAVRLKTCLRETDTVSRLGGDEFVVLLEELSEIHEDAGAQGNAVADKILALIGQPYNLHGHECRITACIGITVFGNDQQSAEQALQQAGIAMHQAKATSRNAIRSFVPALQTAVNARASMEEDLRTAMSRNQFLLYYQPQIDRGVLVGAEALLRWNHPKLGFVPPDEFIPVAEESGLILPLGKWVLETACAQIAAWANMEETAHLTIAVNISARQFQQPDFVEQVMTVLQSNGANPRKLKLELTESMLVNNVEDVVAKMTDLKLHGLRFSVDDFGTGYSSLNYLKRLPLDQLKIDRSFVRDILMDVGSGAIAQSIISLGYAMGFSVIAEGVETEEQREFLAGLGCHSFQGYLFRGPLPLQEFHMLLPSLPSLADPIPLYD